MMKFYAPNELAQETLVNAINRHVREEDHEDVRRCVRALFSSDAEEVNAALGFLHELVEDAVNGYPKYETVDGLDWLSPEDELKERNA